VKAGALLVIPAFGKNHGGGHLVRGAALVRSLRAAGREAFLFLPVISGEKYPVELLGITELNGESWIRRRDPRTSPQPEEHWDFIIFDKFRTNPAEAVSWSALAPLIGIDEGGRYRNGFDFLIDILPNLLKQRYTLPNITTLSLMSLPVTRRPSFHKTGNPLRVLISFGAEDAAGLSFPAAMALGKKASAGELDVTLIAPSLPENRAQTLRASSNCIRISRGIPELREHLAEYDLLITHFGLCAFEAIHARLPVFLVSPGMYHEKLARSTGFFSAGTGPGAAACIDKLLLDAEFLRSLSGRCENIASRYGLDIVPKQKLGDLLAAFTPLLSRVCPACGASFPGHGRIPSPRQTPARFPGRTYRRCMRCGMIYMFRSSPPAIEYKTDYFFDLYKKQYGKTYLEDFPNLIEAGKKRLSVIKRFLNSGTERDGAWRLLDIGCAYGPFLSAARQGGFLPQGIDPVEDAVRYVREELGIPARLGFFPDPSPEDPVKGGSFEVITLWYVIEHFGDLRPVLEEINRLLKTGGMLAFSTPSFSGISGKKSLWTFLKQSPEDHFTLWSPGICRRVLARYGFTLKKIRISGHHPERFPLGNRLRKSGLPWKFLLLMSHLFGLGDTFECYAIKEKDYDEKIFR
jgi:2-polyprenyl-3-methyl-5-hydroxy-6-metoxy-1,4-benzoquinol methylase/spore coat polysaccharide biosynthesis predicted glycosyltransferase SpsG